MDKYSWYFIFCECIETINFSFYKIEYKGEYPESLIKAYQELNELNDKAPREKFKKERKENLSTL